MGSAGASPDLTVSAGASAGLVASTGLSATLSFCTSSATFSTALAPTLSLDFLLNRPMVTVTRRCGVLSRNACDEEECRG